MNIAIVGAGKGGTSILKSFSNLEGINVVQVMARRDDAPGIVLAKKLGIETINSLDKLKFNSVDIVIEATGSPEVLTELKESCKGKYSIIDSLGANLIMIMANRDIATLEKLNSQIEAVQEKSKFVQFQVDEISQSITTTSEISGRLTDFTNTSNKHINDTNKVIKYVNDISKQIHILGINASIEATRAGDQGRGFAVVATEVQKLAKGSSESANSIKSILDLLAGDINSVKRDVDVLEKLMGTQVKSVQNVCGEMADLVKAIE